jgi:hypothetical protein
MKNLLFIIGIFIFCSGVLYSQQQTASSAELNGIKVYSQNGYYVNVKNSNPSKFQYSFKYVVSGYRNDSLISTSNEVYENATIGASESGSLFTAPVSNNREISYWITITEVYFAKSVEDNSTNERLNRRRK